MELPLFDLEVLRTFVLGIELGSFAKAAGRVGRSSSAVSSQLKKLEEQVEVPILSKSGRGLSLTPTGEVLLGYARRLLDLNLEAQHAVRGAELAGFVRIGLQEDFGENLLTEVLGGFVRSHPQVRIEAMVARNAELLHLVGSGQLDLVLAWDSGRPTPHHEVLGQLPMCWVGSKDWVNDPALGPVPLAVLEGPCIMSTAAMAALDRANRSWRVAFTSPSLGGIWAAVAAGLGVTVRTRAGLPKHLKVLSGMPKLPAAGLLLQYGEAQPAPAVSRLSELMKESLAAALGTGTSSERKSLPVSSNQSALLSGANCD
jgi:DNA-binding transcriptional LysR family regulator